MKNIFKLQKQLYKSLCQDTYYIQCNFFYPKIFIVDIIQEVESSHATSIQPYQPKEITYQLVSQNCRDQLLGYFWPYLSYFKSFLIGEKGKLVNSICLTQKIFDTKFFDTKFFFNPQFFLPNFFLNKNFFDENFFLDPKFFLTQKIF